MANKKSKKLLKRNTHNRKIMKVIKFTTLVCFLFLIIELIYIGYNLLCNSKKSIYFDGINSIVSRDNYYVTVGSNNDNDNYYEIDGNLYCRNYSNKGWLSRYTNNYNIEIDNINENTDNEWINKGADFFVKKEKDNPYTKDGFVF